MKIGVIGSGRIGGNCARQAVKAGHEVMLSFERDRSKLESLAAELGDRASSGTPADAAAFGEVVILSVPWGAIPAALEQAAGLRDKVVIDTTNQFGSGPMPGPGQTAASFNAARMPGVRYTGQGTSRWADRGHGLRPRRCRGRGDLPGDGSPAPAGAVYGEEYRAADAQAVLDAVAHGVEIPPTPEYR